MNTLSNIGITSGSKVEAWHVTQSIDAFTGEQEYDIFLSGSLTITGSLTFNQIINNISGNSSYAPTSSHTLYSETSSHALTSSVADNQTTILTSTHPALNISGSYKYYIGNGNITTTGSFNPASLTPTAAGIICPVKGTIISASITSNCATTASSNLFTSKIILGVNLYEQNYTFANSIGYSLNVVNFKEAVGLTVNDGDRLTFLIETDPSSSYTLPTKVTHNIQLYIRS
jgi:hypothetical protein